MRNNNYHTRNRNNENSLVFVFDKEKRKPDWSEFSYRQKLEYVRREIKYVHYRLQAVDAEPKYWRRQLSYYLWLPIHNSLDVETAKANDDQKVVQQDKACSKLLLGLCEKHIPLDKVKMLFTLESRYRAVGKMIQEYDLQALNNLRRNIGLPPEAQRDNFELFEQIFDISPEELDNILATA